MTKYISNISVKDATKILIDNDLQDTQVSDYEASIKAKCYFATRVIQDALREGCKVINPEMVVAEMELLRRDPNSASWGIISPTPEEAEAKRMAAECANDMLDDCIAIVREMKTNFE